MEPPAPRPIPPPSGTRRGHDRPNRGGDARWQRIIDAAAAIFFERGYASATLRDIAERAGVMKGSLYYYIDTKEDLLFALVVAEHEAGLERLVEEPALAAQDAPTRLGSFIVRWMEQVKENLEWSVLVEREFRALSADRRALVAEQRRLYDHYIRSIIAQGIGEGTFDPATDPSVAANTIFQAMNLTHLWFKSGGRHTWSDIAHWYADFFIRGLTRPDEC